MTESNVTNRINGKRTAFLNLGCKVNSYETEAMQQMLKEAGAKVVDFTEIADIYIVNTCTVTNIADRKSRQMLHRAKQKNKDALVVAVGCYVQAAEEELKKDNAVDLLIGNNKKKDVVRIIDSFLSDNEMKDCHEVSGKYVSDISKDTEYEELSLETVVEKTRAYIKIQDGCNQFCSYCIIPYARGRIRSRKMEAVLAEAERLIKQGYQEIVLTGIHLSSYGFEEKSKEEQAGIYVHQGEVPLLSLIRKLNALKKIKRIRLSSLEPRIITEGFVKELSGLKKVCPHFHLSLQSGCDETLKRMNRKYTTEQYEKSCHILRTYFNNPAITTDVIVGFPGETEDEFENTREFLKKISFAQMHIFKYSRRKDTVADKLPHQVPDIIKSQRSSILIALGDELRRSYEAAHYGMDALVLFEEAVMIDEVAYLSGHTEHYEKVLLKTEENLINHLVRVKLIGHLKKELLLSEKYD